MIRFLLVVVVSVGVGCGAQRHAPVADEEAGKDPAALKQVAPDSESKADAMLKAAVAFEKSGNNRLAAHTLRQVYNKYGDTSDKARLLEDMARNFLAMGDDRIDAAAARLATIVTKLQGGGNKLQKPLVLHSGKELAPAGMTINEALKSVQKFEAQAVADHLPDFHIASGPTDKERAIFIEAIQKWRQDGAGPAKRPQFKREPFIPEANQLVIPNVEALLDTPRDLRRQFSRLDRVVAWSNGNIVVFPVGSDKPIGQVALLTDKPTGLAWLDGGKSLLVWSTSQIALMDPSNVSRKWMKELRGPPRIDVIAGGVKEGEPAVAVPAGGQSGGAEAISHVRPVDDRVIVATTAGQIFSIKLNDGSLGWHTRLAAASPIDRVVATDDFTVAKVTDSANTQLVVIDTLTGELVRRMNFANDSGNVPVNLALAANGMLVWTQPDRLCGKDLFEPAQQLDYEIIAGENQDIARVRAAIQVDGQMNAIYSGATQSDQLVISHGRVLAIAHKGKFVQFHSLESGKLLDYAPADDRRVAAILPTSPGRRYAAQISDWAVSLHVVGSVLFVTSRDCAPIMYVLDHPEQSWDGTVDPTRPPNFLYQDPHIGKDYFVLLGKPADPAQPNAPVVGNFRLHAYCRLPLNDGTGRESGRLDYSRDITDPAGISEWLSVEGGFYYRTGDNKLHFLKGARQ